MASYEEHLQNMFKKMPSDRRKVLESFALSLHNASTKSKYMYLNRLKVFSDKVNKPFKKMKRSDVDAFLSRIEKDGTYNSYVQTLKMFFKWLKKEDMVSELKPRRISISISPTELLTPEEVAQLANAAGSVMWKSLISTLFESAARISEILQLKVGDVEFHSVRRKDGGRGLVATLYFKRSKGKMAKEPVAISMFATELKQWAESHPFKDNPQAHLFFSTKYESKADTPLDSSSVRTLLYKAKKLTGIKKKVNPHWLRHSMLSYLANELNYNEQFLMWRAGWTNTKMAERYIHSGGQIENSKYLERLGYVVEKEEKKKILKPKPCPHCNLLNPYTNANCDSCGMPLGLEEYKKVIEQKRSPKDIAEIEDLKEKLEWLMLQVETQRNVIHALLEEYKKEHPDLGITDEQLAVLVADYERHAKER